MGAKKTPGALPSGPVAKTPVPRPGAGGGVKKPGSGWNKFSGGSGKTSDAVKRAGSGKPQSPSKGAAARIMNPKLGEIAGASSAAGKAVMDKAGQVLNASGAGRAITAGLSAANELKKKVLPGSVGKKHGLAKAGVASVLVLLAASYMTIGAITGLIGCATGGWKQAAKTAAAVATGGSLPCRLDSLASQQQIPGEWQNDLDQAVNQTEDQLPTALLAALAASLTNFGSNNPYPADGKPVTTPVLSNVALSGSSGVDDPNYPIQKPPIVPVAGGADWSNGGVGPFLLNLPSGSTIDPQNKPDAMSVAANALSKSLDHVYPQWVSDVHSGKVKLTGNLDDVSTLTTVGMYRVADAPELWTRVIDDAVTVGYTKNSFTTAALQATQAATSPSTTQPSAPDVGSAKGTVDSTVPASTSTTIAASTAPIYAPCHGPAGSTGPWNPSTAPMVMLTACPPGDSVPAPTPIGSQVVHQAEIFEGSIQGCGDSTTLPTTGPMVVGSALGGGRGTLTADELANAVIIVHTGQSLGIPERGLVIAIMTAIVESTLTNHLTATDADSLGLFQQRPSAGWGTPAQVTDPVYASTAFYQHLLRIPNWETMDPGDAAQAVQGSKFPGRYATFQTPATGIVETILGTGTTTDATVDTSPPTTSAGPSTGTLPQTTPATTSATSDSEVAAGKVFVIGDSLTVGTQTHGFPTPPAAATVDAVIGRHTSSAVGILQNTDLSTYSKIIIALGSNDTTLTQNQFSTLINQIMTVIGSTKPVVWVNVDATEPLLTGAASGVNPAITAAHTSHPNLSVGDWNAYINAQPDAATLRDGGGGIHYSPAGYELRAKWMNTLLTGSVTPVSDCGTTGLQTVGAGQCTPQVLQYALTNAPSDNAKTAIQAACTQIGKPYVWGANHGPGQDKLPDPQAFDCSSFVAWAWARGGQSILGTTYAEEQLGTPIDNITDALPGDLIFSSDIGHVVMYLGNNTQIDAPHSGAVVTVEPLNVNGPIRRLN